VADFSTRLRELRGRSGLRQKDLAEKLGLAQTTIANYEQNSRFPDEKTLHRIADQFEVTLDYLLGRTELNLPPQREGYRESPYLDQTERLEPMEPLARSYLDTLLNGDRQAAGRLVLEAAHRGRPVEELYLRVFERTLKEVGRLWAENKVEVGTEHFFTSSTEAIMSQLYPQLVAGARPRSEHTCLVFAVCGELHEVGPRMVADLLEREGWRTYFLGANLCNEDVQKAVEEHKPDLIALSATVPLSVDSAARQIRSLRGNDGLKGLKILVGGRPFTLDPQLWKRVGADGGARDAVDAVLRADLLVGRRAAHVARR
jgi:methanogenic corrinoid protein MtbC1